MVKLGRITVGRPTSIQRRSALDEGLRRQFHHRGIVAVKDQAGRWILFLAQLALEGDALGHFQADGAHRLA